MIDMSSMKTLPRHAAHPHLTTLAWILLLASPLFAQDTAKRTLKSGGRDRAFHLHVPTDLDRDTPVPLLLCFHGAGGNGLGEMRPFRRLADEHCFLLVGADGINKRWNAGCDDEIAATENADDVGFVRDLIAALEGEFPIDRNRIYAYGFSNGAAIAHRLAAELPDTFAAIAAAGATMAVNTADHLKPGAPVSVIIMVGDEDSMFGKSGNLRGGTFHTPVDTAHIWANRNGCGKPQQVNSPVPFTRWPAPTSVGEVEFWYVEGAGHTPNLSTAFNTAEESWAFLARQHKRATVYEGWPFDTEEAKRRQSETAKALQLPTVLEIPLDAGNTATENTTTVKWHLIPAGKFIMGSPDEEDGHEGDERQHPETVSEPFYMMETQLTVAQYRALLKTDPADIGDGSAEIATVPAGMLYRDMMDNVLPAIAKHAPAGWKVILPDRVRMEYAARAGIATMNPGGNTAEGANEYAWTNVNSNRQVQPVAQKRPNAWGLYDVIGNRWHWHWRKEGRYGHESNKDHIVYGGSYRDRPLGNGARLANINISDRPEGVRFALIRATTPPPEGHPETKQ